MAFQLFDTDPTVGSSASARDRQTGHRHNPGEAARAFRAVTDAFVGMTETQEYHAFVQAKPGEAVEIALDFYRLAALSPYATEVCDRRVAHVIRHLAPQMVNDVCSPGKAIKLVACMTNLIRLAKEKNRPHSVIHLAYAATALVTSKPFQVTGEKQPVQILQALEGLLQALPAPRQVARVGFSAACILGHVRPPQRKKRMKALLIQATRRCLLENALPPSKPVTLHVLRQALKRAQKWQPG